MQILLYLRLVGLTIGVVPAYARVTPPIRARPRPLDVYMHLFPDGEGEFSNLHAQMQLFWSE